MSKHSKTMPKGEARPLGTSRVKSSKKRAALALVQTEEIVADAQNALDAAPLVDVDSLHIEGAAAITPLDSHNSQTQEKIMTLTLKGLSKRGNMAIYYGAAVALRIGVSAFANKTPPQTFDVPDGVFVAKTAKPVETKEERKARLKAMPKKTLAEKIAQREKVLEVLRAKAAAEAAPVTV